MSATIRPSAPSPPPATTGCRVLYANQLVIDHRWVWRLSDPFWRLYFNRDPGAAIADKHQRWELPPFRAVLVPPWGDFHGSCTTSVRHFYIHFETPGLPDEWIRRRFREPVTLGEDPILRAMLDELAHETIASYPTGPGRDGRWSIPDHPPISGVGPRWSLKVQSTTAWALARAFAALSPDAEQELNEDPVRALEPAVRWIETHLAEPLSVSALAKRCSLSPDHFGRRFAETTGRTPMRYVQERRVATAADRLVHSDLPLDAIAQGCGFANRFHFSRIFTRLIGTPPARYRRQHRT